jgi:HlyD family secretion protein
MIFAPFDGIITTVDVVQGETATANKSALTIIANNAFQVEANIPEIDIAKLAINNPVAITLDAYGESVVFDGVITRIDPSANLQGNVPMYNVVVSFQKKDPRVRAGMTANVAIITAAKENVLAVPIRFVKVNTDGSGTVYTGKEGALIEHTVTLGIRFDDGTIELLSGAQEGDVLSLIPTGERKAQKEN